MAIEITDEMARALSDEIYQLSAGRYAASVEQCRLALTGIIPLIERAVLSSSETWKKHAEQIREDERAECAKVADGFSDRIIQMWDRGPNSPPGNGWRALSGSDVAAAIRQRNHT